MWIRSLSRQALGKGNGTRRILLIQKEGSEGPGRSRKTVSEVLKQCLEGLQTGSRRLGFLGKLKDIKGLERLVRM